LLDLNWGGNLRLRVPNQIKLSSGNLLANAVGENKNPFYHLEKIPEPVIAEKAVVTLPKLNETFTYDLPTLSGQTNTLIAK